MNEAHRLLAIEVMDSVAHCNGWVNRWCKMKYNNYWLKKIATSAGIFFDKYPQFINFEDISLMCDGGEDERNEKFSALEGWGDLDKCICGYFMRGKV